MVDCNAVCSGICADHTIRIGTAYRSGRRPAGTSETLTYERYKMHAIIETGGKQYRVCEGDVIFVEKLPIEAEDTVVFDKVLALTGEKTDIGSPYVEGASVEGKVIKNGKSKKIIVFKYKPKKNYRRKTGHRQPYTKIQIEKISV